MPCTPGMNHFQSYLLSRNRQSLHLCKNSCRWNLWSFGRCEFHLCKNSRQHLLSPPSKLHFHRGNYYRRCHPRRRCKRLIHWYTIHRQLTRWNLHRFPPLCKNWCRYHLEQHGRLIWHCSFLNRHFPRYYSMLRFRYMHYWQLRPRREIGRHRGRCRIRRQS